MTKFVRRVLLAMAFIPILSAVSYAHDSCNNAGGCFESDDGGYAGGGSTGGAGE